MRVYLLPISTRRTLLYCQKLHVESTGKQTWGGWVQSKAARTWADWEKKDKGWQKSVVNYGNYAFRRIPYEEWGLKSVPPLSQRRREVELNGTEKVEVAYPKSLLAMDKVPRILHALSTEREALHRKRLLWCFVGMPLTIPIGILPLYVEPFPPALMESLTTLIATEFRIFHFSTCATVPGRIGGHYRAASTSSFCCRIIFSC